MPQDMHQFVLLFLLDCSILSSLVDARFGEIYCGARTCYDVLNVTREAKRNEIRRSYRSLASSTHPDKQKTTAEKARAEAHLREINIAYEILMDDEQRREYDEMLDNPQQMYFHYYKYYRRRYSPKVDVRIVIVVIILICSVVQYIGQWTSYKHALSYLVRDPRHRNKAREVAISQGLLTIRRKTDGTKLTREELKEREEDILRTIISQTVELRGDFSKPSLRRVLAVQLIVLPYTCFQWSLWALTWVWCYWILHKPYDTPAKAFLTRRRLGLSQAQWDALDDVRKEEFMEKELWIRANHLAYLAAVAEELRAQSAESSQSKRYRRFVKQSGGPPQLGMEHLDL